MSFLWYRIIREPVERYRACKLSTARKEINFKAPLDLIEKRRGFSHAFVTSVMTYYWFGEIYFNARFVIYQTIILYSLSFSITINVRYSYYEYSLLVYCIHRAQIVQ